MKGRCIHPLLLILDKNKDLKIKQAYRETLSLLGEVYERNESVSITRLLFDDLELDHLKLASDPDLQISSEKYKRLKKYRKELLKKVPVQYVLGYSWFYDRKFRVAPDCLIPRPETEELIYNIKKENIAFESVLDIGTGSSCIAVSIKAEFPGAGVWAMEKFPGTLEIAQHNARVHNAEIHFVLDDILNPSYGEYPGYFDLIVSNPPYVRNSEKIHMHDNVHNFEHDEALFVDDSDPLVFYRAIRDFSLLKLKEGGTVFMEINEGLGNETALVFGDDYFTGTSIIKDIHNKDRFIKTTRNERKKTSR